MGNCLSSRNKFPITTTSGRPGEVSFDDFHILRAIGKGSFGKVCIVQKKDSQKMFAMKYMKKTQCIQQDAFSNVQREIEILSSLEHPFLVNLWFTFQDEEDMFMVVDLLLGGDLRYHLQQSGEFTEDRVTLYVCEVALALDYLRSKCIIHRDIKPDNILLDDAGHAHITDFNIAVVIPPGELATSVTGTRPYIAPEVFQCAMGTVPGYSFPADWWSLGVSTYEMLCRHRPYDIHSNTPAEEVHHMIRESCLRFPRHISKNLADLVQQLMWVDQNERISCAEQLQKHRHMATVDFKAVYNVTTHPAFVPNKNQLNCDPTFELEEMIIESKPLHKKKKRLSKKYSVKERNNVSANSEETDALQTCLASIQKEFIIYNRDKTLQKKSLEDKEALREEETQKVVS